jgi:MbtH protein
VVQTATDRKSALDYVTANWTDMRPASLIRSMNAS